ncbi:MAG: aminopeptidase P N-terminal domain-containing protein [Bacteroidales bacterium]|nr:aminopeptidase P N-terminal domain-containing protein [Bacteroidales bacterium]
MRYEPLPKEFYERNRKALRQKLVPDSLVVVSGNDEIPWSGDQYYPFRQYSDFFYLTGIDQEDSMLCLCSHHPNPSLREVLFIKETSPEMVIWNGEKLTKEQATQLSGIQTVKWNTEFRSVVQEMAFQSRCIYLSLNEAPKFHSPLMTTEKRLAKNMRKRFPAHSFERLAPVLTTLRLVKSAEEIDAIKKSVDITGKALQRVLRSVSPGMLEYQVEAEMTYEFIRNGASSHAYAPIVASGSNACVLHYTANDKMLKDGDLLLMDFGASYGNYASDCSRTIPVNGKFSPRQKDCYNAVLKVFREAIKLYVPGGSIEKINKEVNRMMEEAMIELGLFSKAERDTQAPKKPLYQKYFMHGTSHFMGLDVHDVGMKNETLQKGMVLTCEPGIYIKEEGLGIRIENDIIVDDIPQDLMKDFPIEVEEIEALMRGEK